MKKTKKTKKTYSINITETLRKTVTVEAESLAKAYDKVERMYYDSEVILYPDDYVETIFEQVEEE